MRERIEASDGVTAEDRDSIALPWTRDELADGLRAWGWVIRDGQGWRPLADHMLNLMRLVVKAAVAEEREACCRDACVMCRFVADGTRADVKPAEWSERLGAWYHFTREPKPHGNGFGQCDAAAIRERKP